ncbi:hypothetical protein KIN20_017857 [Parelaphostrongylus tenuis]|uniref:Uncharacterized protein n=1 Tax=Parelaphostrongylus tenuis TaxID=148309 RepID=A0AAD5MJ28_PARTN|nr:hypothetical protein KIN20_017857 [Parelaphostrongylus tenuis]
MDEKIFTVEPLHNRQNRGQPFKGLTKIRSSSTMGCSHSASVMVWTAFAPPDTLKDMMPQNCIAIGNTVTGICTLKRGAMCMTGMNLESVPNAYLSISGTLSNTNTIMANWSRSMWQNVLNRALRILAAGPLGSHFFSASATFDGN